jgi:hypothetical protein
MLFSRKQYSFIGFRASHPNVFAEAFFEGFFKELWDVNALDRCVPGYV